MSTPILILGKSGSGKSRSIKTLDPKKTFIINVCGKDLPFAGWRKNYTLQTKEKTGNLLSTDNSEIIGSTIRYISENRPEIETIIIDDFQYIMANEFMRRAKEKGYEKFTEIGNHAWTLLWDSRLLRTGLFIVFLAHSEMSDSGETKCKTIGKMLDDKICVEGMFTIVLSTSFEDGKYFFETQTTGQNTTKSPEGMFSTMRIDNDLQYVITSIKKYEGVSNA
jgi:hypothetical protein